MLTATSEQLLWLPKAELHTSTSTGRCGRRRCWSWPQSAVSTSPPIPLPSGSSWPVSDASRLEDYLERFHLTLTVMQAA